jgi:PAS domain S-box-containing protein
MTASQPEARILGKLLVLQQNLELLPALEEQATFIRRTLREIPGLADVGFCLRGRWISASQNSDAICFLPEDSGHDPPQAHALRCCAAGGPRVHSIPLRTASKLYGFMVLTIADAATLAPYIPYLANIANHMALLRERQAMGEELRRTLQGLEQQVEARTAELSMKNALLEREIQQREQAQAALRQSHEVLEQRVRERTAELEASEERLRSIITTAVDGIVTIDDQGMIEFFNPAAERLFGYAADEVMGRNVRNLIPRSFRERHDGQMSRRLSAGKKVNFEREVVGRRKDGSTFPLELAVSEMRIGEARKFTGILRDITERKRAEARILESEARFRQMADRAPVMIWVTDESRGCIYFNEPWLEFTGRPLEQELGSGWAEGVHPEDRDRCLSVYVAAFEARQAFEMEYRLRRHSGEYRWILDRGFPAMRRTPSFSGISGHASTSTTASASKRPCARRTGARMNSWRCSGTNCATPWPPSAMPLKSCASGGSIWPISSAPSKSSSGRWATSPNWWTTSSMSRASPGAKSSFRKSPWTWRQCSTARWKSTSRSSNPTATS